MAALRDFATVRAIDLVTNGEDSPAPSLHPRRRRSHDILHGLGTMAHHPHLGWQLIADGLEWGNNVPIAFDSFDQALRLKPERIGLTSERKLEPSGSILPFSSGAHSLSPFFQPG